MDFTAFWNSCGREPYTRLDKHICLLHVTDFRRYYEVTFALLTPLTPGSWLALIGLEILGLRILLERKIISIIPHKYRR